MFKLVFYGLEMPRILEENKHKGWKKTEYFGRICTSGLSLANLFPGILCCPLFKSPSANSQSGLFFEDCHHHLE